MAQSQTLPLLYKNCVTEIGPNGPSSPAPCFQPWGRSDALETFPSRMNRKSRRITKDPSLICQHRPWSSSCYSRRARLPLGHPHPGQLWHLVHNSTRCVSKHDTNTSVTSHHRLKKWVDKTRNKPRKRQGIDLTPCPAVKCKVLLASGSGVASSMPGSCATLMQLRANIISLPYGCLLASMPRVL